MSVIKEAVAQTDGKYSENDGLLTIEGDQIAVMKCPDYWTTCTFGADFRHESIVGTQKRTQTWTKTPTDNAVEISPYDGVTKATSWGWKVEIYLMSRTEKEPDKVEPPVEPEEATIEYVLWLSGYKLELTNWNWNTNTAKDEAEAKLWAVKNAPTDAKIIGVLKYTKWSDGYEDSIVTWQKELFIEGQPESHPADNPPAPPSNSFTAYWWAKTEDTITNLGTFTTLLEAKAKAEKDLDERKSGQVYVMDETYKWLWYKDYPVPKTEETVSEVDWLGIALWIAGLGLLGLIALFLWKHRNSVKKAAKVIVDAPEKIAEKVS